MTSQVGVGPGHRVLGRYELVRYVDSGGAGTVWEAHDHTLGQTVALKHVTFPSATPAQREEADRNRARTLREARFAAQLRNRPHVVAIYDVQEVDGDIWLVLEYLPSRSLRGTLAQVGVLDPSQVARIGAAVADALAAAHAEGITHRDVKPGNVLLGDDGKTIKLTDFGVAHSDHEHGLTSTGIVSGTPAYMAPEQARGENCTPAADVFSLGATLYRAVEGQPPYGDDENHVALMHRVAYGTTRPLQRAGPFTPLLMHLLEHDPATRPDAATAHRLLDDYSRRATSPTAEVASVPPSAVPTGSAPGASTTPPFPPPSREQGPGRWRRHRAALIALGVVVVLGLAAAGVGLGYALRSDPTAVPELPEQVAALSLNGDPTTADPCRLVDPAVMSRFGAARVGPGTNTGECRVTSEPAGGRRSWTDVHYSNAATEHITPSGPERPLGGLTIVPAATAIQGACTTYLRLADSTTIGLSTSGAPEPPADLCAVNQAAVAVAVNRLDQDAVVHTPGWQGGISMAGRNACDLLGDTSAVAPGLNGLRRSAYPNGSNCYVGDPGAATEYANVELALDARNELARSTPVPVGGKAVYTFSGSGYYHPTACQVWVVHRPTYDGGVTRPTEAVVVRLEGPQPFDQLCRSATAMGLLAEHNIG